MHGLLNIHGRETQKQRKKCRITDFNLEKLKKMFLLNGSTIIWLPLGKYNTILTKMWWIISRVLVVTTKREKTTFSMKNPVRKLGKLHNFCTSTLSCLNNKQKHFWFKKGTKCFNISNLFIYLLTLWAYYTHYQGTAFKSFTFHFY